MPLHARAHTDPGYSYVQAQNQVRETPEFVPPLPLTLPLPQTYAGKSRRTERHLTSSSNLSSLATGPAPSGYLPPSPSLEEGAS